MKDIDHVNILDGLVFEIVFDKVEKSGVEKLKGDAKKSSKHS